VTGKTGLDRLYERLRTAGPGVQVVLTACMRKCWTMLKAMVKPVGKGWP